MHPWGGAAVVGELSGDVSLPKIVFRDLEGNVSFLRNQIRVFLLVFSDL